MHDRPNLTVWPLLPESRGDVAFDRLNAPDPVADPGVPVPGVPNASDSMGLAPIDTGVSVPP